MPYRLNRFFFFFLLRLCTSFVILILRLSSTGNYDSLPQASYLLQPTSLHALQKLQIENLQKIHELDAVGLLEKKIQAEFESTDFPQVPADILEKYPELLLKAPELIQKFPEILKKIPHDALAKNPDILKFLNATVGKTVDAGTDANSSTESVDNDSIPIDLSNDKSSDGGKSVHHPTSLLAEYDYDKIIDRSPMDGAGDEIWCKYLRPFAANETCIDGNTCEDAAKDHFHCVAEGCNVIFR